LAEEWDAKERERAEVRKGLRSHGGDGTSQEDDEGPRFVSYVPLPEEEEIERRVVARKKQELLSKYASDGLIQQQEEAKQMLNVRD
jgi:pre-mRNA-splicing factor ISY1